MIAVPTILINFQLTCKFTPLLRMCKFVNSRDGQLRVDDQITHINGHALKEMSHNEGVKLLQSARGMVELIVMRDSSHSHAPPVTNTSSLHHRKMSPDPPSTTNGTATNGYGSGVAVSHALNYQDQVYQYVHTISGVPKNPNTYMYITL